MLPSPRLVAVLTACLPLLAFLTPAKAQDTAPDADAGLRSSTMLVLDASGSMAEPAGGGSTKIQAAKQALTDVVAALPDDAVVGMRVFGAEVFSRDQPGACTDSQQVVAPGTDNRDALLREIERYRPFGETPIGYALRQAAKDLDPDTARSIVLVSDGIATCQPDPCEVARELASQGVDLRVDVVGLGVGPDARAQLRCIAAAADGRYYDASSADEIVDSLSTATERALRPFRVDGEPVRGGDTQAGAVPLTQGRFADSLGRRAGDRWYFYEREDPDATVHASYYELQPGGLSDLDLAVVDADDGWCSTSPTPVFHTLFTGYAAVVPADAEGCEDGMWIRVRRPVDGEEGASFGIAVVEEPAVTDPASLPDEDSSVDDAFAVPRPTDRAEEVVAGATFEDALAIEPGTTYAATVVPGEVNAFRVPVGWGQRLTVRIDRPALDAQLEGATSTSYFDIQVMSPVRATVQDDLPAGTPSDRRAGDDATTQLSSVGPVRWSARTSRADTAYLAGDYYVLYGADFEVDGSPELPYEITVEVQGEETGVPTYAASTPSPSTSSPTGSDPTGAPESETAEPQPSGERDLVVPVVVAALVLVVVGVAVTLVRRRRG